MPSRLRPTLVGLAGALRRTSARPILGTLAGFAGLLAVAACSTEGVMAMRPDVDVGARTGAVPAPIPEVPVAVAEPSPAPALAPAYPPLSDVVDQDPAPVLAPAE